MALTKISVDIDEIKQLLPHREPFLFVDRVTGLEKDVRIRAQRDLLLDEPHYRGHFPGNPIMPGVLTTEALAQTSGLLLALSARMEGSDPGGGEATSSGGGEASSSGGGEASSSGGGEASSSGGGEASSSGGGEATSSGGGEASSPGGGLFYLAKADIKWSSPARPPDTLILESKHVRTLSSLVAFAVRAYTKTDEIASGTLTLARVRSDP